MKNSEIRELTKDEIIERIEGERATLSKQRLNHAVSPLDNPLKITETRKVIARLMTELRQRTLNEDKKS
jgi:large subunit ribosomal protein L29